MIRFGFVANRNRVSALLTGLQLLASSAHAGDFVWSDDFEAMPSWDSMPAPGIAAAASPQTHATNLGTQVRFLVKIRSCGYSGNTTLGVANTPGMWGVAADPPTLSPISGALAVTKFVVDIATDGDHGSVARDVTAQATTNTAHATANFNVANQVIIAIPDGTGSTGPHFPLFTRIKLGTMVRFVNDDSTASHRIHANYLKQGFVHRANDMSLGQEYDVLVNTIGTYEYYCHDHLPAQGFESHLIVE